MIDDSEISRIHCTVEKIENVWQLQDAESINGTKVNGEALVSRILRDGDLIELGNHKMVFVELTKNQLPGIKEQITKWWQGVTLLAY